MTVFRVPSPPPLGEDCGPDYWTKRRAEWLQSPSEGKPKEYNGQRSTDPDPQQKLVDILDEPGAAENDAYWFGGLQRIWKALIGCASVKHPLPLRTAVSRCDISRALLIAYCHRRDSCIPVGLGMAHGPEGLLQRHQQMRSRLDLNCHRRMSQRPRTSNLQQMILLLLRRWMSRLVMFLSAVYELI
jgi:hypothetical protein